MTFTLFKAFLLLAHVVSYIVFVATEGRAGVIAAVIWFSSIGLFFLVT